MQTAKAAADERLKTQQANEALKKAEAGLADASEKQLQSESETQKLELQVIALPLSECVTYHRV